MLKKKVNTMKKLYLFTIILLSIIINTNSAISEISITEHSPLPEWEYFSLTVCNENVFALSKSSKLYKYNTESDQWIYIESFPLETPYNMLTINSTIFLFGSKGKVISFEPNSNRIKNMANIPFLEQNDIFPFAPSGHRFNIETFFINHKIWIVYELERSLSRVDTILYQQYDPQDEITSINEIKIPLENYHSVHGVFQMGNYLIINYLTQPRDSRYTIMFFDLETGTEVKNIKGNIKQSCLYARLHEVDSTLYSFSEAGVDYYYSKINSWQFIDSWDLNYFIDDGIIVGNTFYFISNMAFYSSEIPAINTSFMPDDQIFNEIEISNTFSLFNYDYDKDNDDDLFFYTQNAQDNLFIYNNNNGQFNLFNSKHIFPQYKNTFSLSYLADINNNGNAEIIGNYSSNYGEDGKGNNPILAATILSSGKIEEIHILDNVQSSRSYCLFDSDNNGELDYFFNSGNREGARLYKSFNQSYYPFYSGTEKFKVSISWPIDYNNDGFIDLFTSKGDTESELYLNNGNGSFEHGGFIKIEPFQTIIPICFKGADLNKDSKQDYLIGCYYGNGQHYHALIMYKSENGYNTFELPNTSGYVIGDIELVDLDANGFVDIIVFLNDDLNSGIISDIDSDGDMDIVSPVPANIYLNDGNNIEFYQQIIPQDKNYVFLNTFDKINNPPRIPDNITIDGDEDNCRISWNSSIDDLDNFNLKYNIRIGTTSDNQDILSILNSESPDITTNNFKYIINLKPGTYYVSIKAIDSGYRESNWSIPKSFVISNHDKTPPQSISDLNYEIFHPYPRIIAKSQSNDMGAGVSLFWTNPNDPDYFITKIVRNSQHFPENIEDGTIIYEGNNTTCVDSFLIANSDYYYSAFAFDEVGNISSIDSDAQCKVNATNNFPPEISHIPIKFSYTDNNTIHFSSVIDEDIALQSTKLYYRFDSEPNYTNVDLTKNGRVYYADISLSNSIKINEIIEYYFYASDGYNKTYLPNNFNINPFKIMVYPQSTAVKLLTGKIYDIMSDKGIKSKLTIKNVTTNTDSLGYYRLFLDNKIDLYTDTLIISDCKDSYYGYKNTIEAITNINNGNIALVQKNIERMTGKDLLDSVLVDGRGFNNEYFPIYEVYNFNWKGFYFNDLPIKVYIDYSTWNVYQSADADSIKKRMKFWEKETNLRLFQFVNQEVKNGINIQYHAGNNAAPIYDDNRFIKMCNVSFYTDDAYLVMHEVGHALGFADAYLVVPNISGIMGDDRVPVPIYLEKVILRMYYSIPNYYNNNKLTTYRDEFSNFYIHNDQIANNSPTFMNISFPDTIANYDTLAINLSATDPENDQLSYIVSNDVDGMHIDPISGNGYWVPNKNQIGFKQISFFVSDGEYETQTTQNIYVQRVYQPPKIYDFNYSNLGNFATSIDTTLNFKFRINDIDSDTSYIKTIINDSLVNISSILINENNIFYFDFTPKTVGTYIVEFIVLDENNNSDSLKFEFDVTELSGLYNNNVIPKSMALEYNYPNPFNSNTTIKYSINKPESVTISIYNSIGEEIIELINNKHNPGYYEIQWAGTDNFNFQVSSGIYFVKLTASNFESTIKILLLQ